METPEEKIQHLEKMRDEFLKKHPELKKFQDEVERRLSKAGDSTSRMKVLSIMMEENVQKMESYVKQLENIIKN